MDNYTIKDGFLSQKMIVLPNAVKKRIRNNVISNIFLFRISVIFQKPVIITEVVKMVVAILFLFIA